MQFPASWLREFCDPPLSTAELAELLTMSGFEVEELRPVAPPFSGVVVAEIVEAAPHPSADRLRVCRVDAGAMTPEGPLQIVCGAPNARVGLRAPLAMVGAELPPGEDGKAFRIGVGRLRGVESLGMLCSARELGLSADHAGLLELAASAVPGTPLREALALDDTIFTLKLTPNLGHALSVQGIAREVSALTGVPLKATACDPVAAVHTERLPVHVQASDLCGRFSGRVIRGVDTRAATPAWMVQRLERCGQRSISALVDISNYVMFELGRPTHIFDRDRIEDRLEVRWGRPGERLELLNGQTIELDASVGVIADARQVESLAGIMGGQATAVGDETRNVYVEAAFWWPQAVAGRSRRFNFSTDAGHRFERGVDPALTVAHIERITALILQICGGEPGPVDDQILGLPERASVTMRVARAAKVLGMPLTQAECAGVFRRLGLAFTEGEGAITVTPPSWRFDLALEEDLIEEVVRVLGLHRLPATPPQARVTARPVPERRRPAHAVRHALAARGYHETINFSFVEARLEAELAGNTDPIRVLNPIAAPLAVMRSSLMGSLMGVLRTNLARRAPRVRVFEIGRVFRRDPSVPESLSTVAGVAQPLRVAGLAFGSAEGLQWGHPERPVDFHDVKGDLESLLAPRVLRFVADTHPALHPGRCARIESEGRVLGHLGELHPRWRQSWELPQAPVLFELELDAVLDRPLPAFAPLPRQQAALRDVALVVGDAVRHDALVQALRADPQGLVRAATLFDVYRGGAASSGLESGERSLAIRLELLDEEATLTDERIDAAVGAAVARAAAACGARLRG
ncbi:MAG: phenylalanine--tRNA ligase subunit beta [Rubrivivax sp.]